VTVDRYGKQWGISSEKIPLVSISPALDLILSRPADPAHSEYNGLSKQMHELLVEAILSVSAAKLYAAKLSKFPFPPGWGRLQSPLHHLKSYSLSDHARWSIIVPCLLRLWLRKEHLHPLFFAAAAKHTTDPVAYVVSSFAAVAKSNSVLMGDKISPINRINLLDIVKHARLQYQTLCRDAAGSINTNRRSRTPTPQRYGKSQIPSILGPNRLLASSQVVQDEPVPSMLALASIEADDGPTPDKKKASQYLNDAKRPNFHTVLHYVLMADEYGLLSNCNVLIGEDKHR
jgi:hypothetical protein